MLRHARLLAVLELAVAAFAHPAAAQSAPQGCPPFRRCTPTQMPPALTPQEEQAARTRLASEEEGRVRADVGARAPALRAAGFERVDRDRYDAWIDRGRLPPPDPVPLRTPLWSVASSMRLASWGGRDGLVSLGPNLGVRFDGVPVGVGRLAFEVVGSLETLRAPGLRSGTATVEPSVVWMLPNRSPISVRLGAILGRSFEGVSSSAIYGGQLALGLELLATPLGDGGYASVGVEFGASVRGGDGVDPLVSTPRFGVFGTVGPRLAF